MKGPSSETESTTSESTVNSSDQPQNSAQAVSQKWSNGETYEYGFLLDRIYDMLKEKNPSLTEKKKFTVKPPQVQKIGAKKSCWLNFAVLLKFTHLIIGNLSES